jgi:hypothetical protein
MLTARVELQLFEPNVRQNTEPQEQVTKNEIEIRTNEGTGKRQVEERRKNN